MIKRPFYTGIGIMMLVTLLIYSNHFTNTFQFDDFHTIVNNANIRSLKNIPRFFKDGSTMSVLPQNQAYRPVTVSSLAIDYWLAGDYYPSYFQASTFILFLLQGLLMVLLFKKLFDKSLSNNHNTYPAIIAATWYMLHPANAETVNYIIARADVQSTLMVLLAFVLYIYSPFCRKTFLYLLPVGIGALCKPPAVMFAPLLFCYLLLFEQELGFTDLFKKTALKQVWTVFLKTVPSFIFCALLYVWIDKMTPNTWEPGGTSPMQYFITQPFVILHYFCEFFLPTSLSADTDWTLLPSIGDVRFFAGSLFIVLMIVAAFYTAKNKSTKPISFGIIWFFLALLPTSSIIPLGEVLNDHRMYFPFVGLVISVSWTVVLLLREYGKQINKRLIIASVILLFAAYGYGTYQRNKVWHTQESLWRDVSIKSPLNGRGLMNYGVALVTAEKYAEAEKYFQKAMRITPDYALLYTNMGYVKEKEGQLQLAENYYKAGIQLGNKVPDTYYFYGLFLIHQLRYSEAEPILLQAVKLSPLYLAPQIQLMNIYSKMIRWNDVVDMANQTLHIAPGNAGALSYLRLAIQKRNELDLEGEKIKNAQSFEKYLDLSLKNYQSARYVQSIGMAQQALKISPSSAEAYNNIGAAYIKLKQYQQADTVLRAALQLRPNFKLAKNNLLQAQQGLEDAGIKPTGLTAADFIDISLICFNQGLFKQCIINCNYALELQPNYPLAYNNICAANNQLHHWDEAIAAAKKGLQLKPDYEVLKNNLAVAEKGKSGRVSQSILK
ncbi:Tfp pilus assembly protein PilF [Mucilaginibacter frigoritolerans]|uniref:Tfp pilus assembly protein PilF n=1 Tax=Mucilaginibacter frigoritolerans TaxID=652788 RepID=A0A562UBS1_9SPHI|nr:tetratricopeptide repeat protein [Mucilaginibacter frigoritolerans]TWJ03232.1 Tfp pilus assembly protein PilF [Mucilaginibacter frigoritolerans]